MPKDLQSRLKAAPLRFRVRLPVEANFWAYVKNPLVVSHPLSGYGSCSPFSGLGVVAEWTVVDGPLVMGGQDLRVFSTGTCWFRDFLVISGLCAP
jgi:hypothetical protein